MINNEHENKYLRTEICNVLFFNQLWHKKYSCRKIWVTAAKNAGLPDNQPGIYCPHTVAL